MSRVLVRRQYLCRRLYSCCQVYASMSLSQPIQTCGNFATINAMDEAVQSFIFPESIHRECVSMVGFLIWVKYTDSSQVELVLFCFTFRMQGYQGATCLGEGEYLHLARSVHIKLKREIGNRPIGLENPKHYE